MKKIVHGAVVVCLMMLGGTMLHAQAAEKPAPAAQATTATDAKGAEGTWQGTLTPAGDKTLRIVLKLARNDGKWSATMYSIDQAAPAFKADTTTVQGDVVKFEVKLIGGAFDGKLGPDGKQITGTWTQGPGSMPFNMVRATPETAWEIPPPPAPPKLMPANADPSFDVATIKPNNSGATQMKGLHVDGSNRFSTDSSSLSDLISFAYDLQLKQIAGSEGWMSDDRFDVMAKPDIEGSPNPTQLKTMVKKLLADRFQLKFHDEKRDMSAYVLTVAKGGQKITQNESKDPLPGLGFRPAAGGIGFVMRNATMTDFSGLMQILVLDRPMVDETGLTGRYDMSFTFTPDDSMFNGHAPPMPPSSATTEQAPRLPEAMEQQVGLKLEAKKTPVRVLVIDHVEKPSAN